MSEWRAHQETLARTRELAAATALRRGAGGLERFGGRGSPPPTAGTCAGCARTSWSCGGATTAARACGWSRNGCTGNGKRSPRRWWRSSSFGRITRRCTAWITQDEISPEERARRRREIFGLPPEKPTTAAPGSNPVKPNRNPNSPRRTEGPAQDQDRVSPHGERYGSAPKVPPCIPQNCPRTKPRFP